MALSEEEIAAGWIEWAGGQYPPVPQSQEVEFLDRGGFYAIERVNIINWRHNTPCPSVEVVAYRLAERSAAKPEKKERSLHFVARLLYDSHQPYFVIEKYMTSDGVRTRVCDGTYRTAEEAEAACAQKNGS